MHNKATVTWVAEFLQETGGLNDPSDLINRDR